MLRIPIPNSEYAEQTVTLNGETYSFLFKYNTRAARWKLDIKDSLGEDVINGLTLVENIALTSHLSLPPSFGGDLFCVQLENGDSRLGKDNVGVNKTHELIYVGGSELE